MRRATIPLNGQTWTCHHPKCAGVFVMDGEGPTEGDNSTDSPETESLVVIGEFVRVVKYLRTVGRDLIKAGGAVSLTFR
jgi:hypothetical protein